MLEAARFALSLLAFPFMLLDDLLHRDAEEAFIAAQRQRFIDLAEGE